MGLSLACLALCTQAEGREAESCRPRHQARDPFSLGTEGVFLATSGGCLGLGRKAAPGQGQNPWASGYGTTRVPSPQNQQLNFKGNIPASNTPVTAVPILAGPPHTCQNLGTCCPGHPATASAQACAPTHCSLRVGHTPRVRAPAWPLAPPAGCPPLRLPLNSFHIVTHSGCPSGDPLPPTRGE